MYVSYVVWFYTRVTIDFLRLSEIFELINEKESQKENIISAVNLVAIQLLEGIVWFIIFNKNRREVQR